MTDKSQAQSRPVLFYETLSGQSSYPEHITFTSNSEQLVIKERNAELPIVMSLPAEILSALDTESVHPEESEEQQNNQEVIRTSALDLASLGTSNRHLVSSAYVKTVAAGKAVGFAPITSIDNASVLLWRDTGTGLVQKKFEIVKFPA
jgi:hypothetical protein